VIWDEALAGGFVLIGKDEDFARRRSLTTKGPQVVWIRLGNTRRVALLAHLDGVWLQLEAALERGEPLVEVSWSVARSRRCLQTKRRRIAAPPLH
jgi:predicted nuclease of predicted toxin-antitoxin system